jgi:nitric oxide reductase NorD protein
MPVIPRGSLPSLPSAAASFVRALWGLDVSVQVLPGSPNELAPSRPRFNSSQIWLPASALFGTPGASSSYVLAAAAHASAHLRFGAGRFQVKDLKPAQIAIISLLEDARVERLAASEYPGLIRLWRPFHVARAEGAKTAAALFARLARALHDEAYVDEDAWVNKARALFWEQGDTLHDAGKSRRLGGALGNDLGQMRVQFSAKDYLVQPPYRDDNVGLWQFEPASAPDGSELEFEGRRVSPESERSSDQQRCEGPPEAANFTRFSGRDAARGARLDSTPAGEPAQRYPEWDYVIARERANFCTVYERTAPAGDVPSFDGGSGRDASLRRRLAASAQRLARKRPTQLRRLTSGDRLDLTAVVANVVARATAQRSDPRVYRRLHFHNEPPALLVLVDVSESLNDAPPAASTTLLELARNACALLASTLTAVTRHLAVHGFSSNGRHDVGYYRFKDFEQPYDDQARASIAGMRASRSTRLGAALRHAGRALAAATGPRKLLLVITDGEPADVDVHDPKYLTLDAKQATLHNRQVGVHSFCVGLAASAEPSIRTIFGMGNYLLLDRLDTLPEKLTELCLRLSQ